MENNIVFYDFDNTLYNGDSMYDFFIHVHGKPKFYMLFLIFILKEVFLNNRILSPSKESFLNTMRADISPSVLKEHAVSFFRKNKNKINRTAKKDIMTYKNKSYKTMILTASLDIWVKPFADFLKMELISTAYKIDDNNNIIVLSNTKGERKTKEVKRIIKDGKYKEIVAYGDSKSDLCLKEVTTRFYYREY